MNLLNLSFSAFVAVTLIMGLQSQGRLQSFVVIEFQDGQRRTDLGIACEEGCKFVAFDDERLGKFALPPHIQPGHWITLELVNLKTGREEWVLISPWKGRTVVPLHAIEKLSVVVVRKG